MSDRHEAERPTGGSVLVAEGDQATRDFLASALADAGFRVDLASDGLEAIGRLEAHDYDALVVDLHLARTDGLGVLHFISERQPALLERIVLVTGLPLPEIGALYPICATLSKPISPKRLLEVIRICVSRREPEHRA